MNLVPQALSCFFWHVGSVMKLQLVLSLLLNLNFCRCCVFKFHLLSCIACSLVRCCIVCCYSFSVSWKFIPFSKAVGFFSSWAWLVVANRKTFSSFSTFPQQKEEKKRKRKKKSLVKKRDMKIKGLSSINEKRPMIPFVFTNISSVQFLNLVWPCFCSLCQEEKTAWIGGLRLICFSGALLRTCLYKNVL